MATTPFKRAFDNLVHRVRSRPRTYAVTVEVDPGLAFDLHQLAQEENRTAGDLAAELVSEEIDRFCYTQTPLEMFRDLPPRQQDVVALTCLGYTHKEIALRLGIRTSTVKTHLDKVFEKFAVRSKADLRAVFKDWDFSNWEKG